MSTKNIVNKADIDAWRMEHNLEPIYSVEKERKKEKNKAQQRANREAHAQFCRDLKDRRNSGKK